MTEPEKNYMTRQGFDQLERELRQLVETDRPLVVDTVSWAASNGDRSENGDYIYGKKRLREIDRRLRFLTKRLDCAVIVDPSLHRGREQIFFGATVRFIRLSSHTMQKRHAAKQQLAPKVEAEVEAEVEVTILGVDEIDSGGARISWHSPMARALLKARLGDEVVLQTPNGAETLLITAVEYPAYAAP